MFKKKLVALGVSAVAVTAVAGAGFAGWVFDDNLKVSQDLGITITGATSFGKLEKDADSANTVVLDQSGITLQKGTDASKNTISAKWTVANDAYTDATTNHTVAYSANVYIKTTTLPYINAGASGTAGTGDYSTYTKYVCSVTTSVDTLTSTTETYVTLTLAANTFAYDTTNKPDTMPEYEAMVKAFDNTVTSVTPGTDYSVADSAQPIVVEFTVVVS